MAFVEDRQLLELSISPKKSLFPVLSRAEAMSPLIVLLALIPPLYVLVNRTLTPLDALWGLKAVAMMTSDSALTWFDPATPPEGTKDLPLKWQPPLSTWLVAGVMHETETHRPLALVLTALLATAGLILCAFGLANRLRGPQFAWWTACLLALHGPVLQGAQTPAPVSLTLAFALAALWGFVVHSQDSKRLFSMPLFWGGAAWGLCLLAGGPVALIVLALLLLYVLSLSQEAKLAKKTNGKTRRVWKGRPAFESLALMVGLGLAVGGWWGIWMVFRHGFDFLKGWFVGPSYLPASASVAESFLGRILFDVSQMGGALIGPTVLGVWIGIKLLRQPSLDVKHSGLVLILSWAGLAGLVWLCLRASSHPADAFSVVWRGFCLVPATMLAALAIEQIDARRIGYFGVLFGLCLMVVILLIWPVEIGFGWGTTHRPVWPSLRPVFQGFSNPSTPWILVMLWRVIFLASLAGLACWAIWRALRNNDYRQRIFLGLSLALFVVLHGLLGFVGVRQATLDDRAISNLRKEMVDVTQVDRWTIVTPQHSPLMLRFLLTSFWPEARSLEVASWWDPRLTEDVTKHLASDGTYIVMDWNDRDIRPPTLSIADPAGNPYFIEFTPAGSPQILWNHRLRPYRLTHRPIPSPK